jgi:hypothetical protein
VFAKHDLHAVLPRGGVLAVVLAVLIAMKVAALLFAMPLPDEGYYWLWGQHPGWSYYDHPPLGGWLHALTSFLFGDGIVPARLATLPTFAGTLAILWYWCGRLTPPFLRMRAFLTGVAIWLASPLMLVYQSLAIHDHLLIVFSLAALHFFVLFAESRTSAGRAMRCSIFAPSRSVSRRCRNTTPSSWRRDLRSGSCRGATGRDGWPTSTSGWRRW